MAEYQIYTNNNNEKYFIAEVNAVNQDDGKYLTTITWTTDQSRAKTFEKQVVAELLPILALNGKDYGSVRKK